MQKFEAVYSVFTDDMRGEKYVGPTEGYGDTPEAAMRSAAERADEEYGRRCRYGVDLKQGEIRERGADGAIVATTQAPDR